MQPRSSSLALFATLALAWAASACSFHPGAVAVDGGAGAPDAPGTTPSDEPLPADGGAADLADSDTR